MPFVYSMIIAPSKYSAGSDPTPVKHWGPGPAEESIIVVVEWGGSTDLGVQGMEVAEEPVRRFNMFSKKQLKALSNSQISAIMHILFSKLVSMSTHCSKTHTHNPASSNHPSL